MAEMFNLARVVECDPQVGCPAIVRYDERWRQSIISQVGRDHPWDWQHPVFADMVGVRDFLEEKRAAVRFKRIFPRRKTLDRLTPCIERPGYCDRSLIAWVRMDVSDRLAALERGRSAYELGLADG
jgi:hypothetical protein